MALVQEVLLATYEDGRTVLCCVTCWLLWKTPDGSQISFTGLGLTT